AVYRNRSGGRERGSACSASRLDRLNELQLAALDVVDTVVSQRGVAVLVDVVLAENAVATLRVIEELLAPRLAVVGLVANGLQRVQRQLHRLVAVDGIRVRLRDAVLPLEVVEKLRRLLGA